MTNPQLPLISVGMPVRNEARFLRQALDSLVNQTNVRTEIIISDNASTDETEAICRYYCDTFPQIRYHRFEQNVGASANFRFVLESANGEYFIWAAGHDVRDNNFMEECSKLLQTEPGAVIAFATTHWIDDKGNRYPKSSGWSDTRDLSILGRYFTVFWGNMNPIIAMIRTKPLREQRFDDMVGVDLAILLALSLRGDFVHAWQTHWYRREFRREVDYKQKLERYRSADYALSTNWLGRYFPLARLPVRIISDVCASNIPPTQKLMILLILLPSLPIKYIADKARKRANSNSHNASATHGDKSD